MKKPNLTEGKWKFVDEDGFDGIEIGVPCEDGIGYYHVATAHEISEEEQEANAKAISAVPEMIDVLIKLISRFDIDKKEMLHPELVKDIEEAKQALKKAGCTQ